MSEAIDEIKTIHAWETEEWKALEAHAEETKDVHLRSLLEDASRSEAFLASFDGIFLDYSRQRMSEKTWELLLALAERTKLTEKMALMHGGAHINVTEDRAVMHTALRAPREAVVTVDGENVVPAVHAVLDRVNDFSDSVRQGMWRGATGEAIRAVVSIGIGGSYLGPEFVYEALRAEPTAHGAAEGRVLRFLANVDPVDVSRALEGLDPATTLVVVVSKTFTTAETMLNARTVRTWLRRGMEGAAEPATIIAKHMVAVSANVEGAGKFGIRPENVFGFWDWVGGRYSVSSSVGVVPLALHFGFPVVQRFLEGAHAMDRHFAEAPLRSNLPALLGLIGVWNSSFLRHPTRALLPYSQALVRFAAHIQQVDMESNGKRVSMDGTPLPFSAGEVNFGEPGTNGQHSFYQLMHQGQVVPADFIGFCESQTPQFMSDEPVSNHDELMSNFFAQPDALALGKTEEQVKAEGASDTLAPHKVFSGNRPSSSLLLPRLDAYTCGQLLALYEHRTAVQGFIWGVCSFDQWGVELGKVLAKQVRSQLQVSRDDAGAVSGFNASTTALLNTYLSHKQQPSRRRSRASFG